MVSSVGIGQKDLQYVPSLLHAAVPQTDLSYTTDEVDIAAQLAEDEYKRTVLLDKMLYFGKEFQVQIDFFQVAEKTELPQGDYLYQYKIICPNAISVNLIFDQFKLAEGTRLYVVDPVKQKFDGAFTSLNNNAQNMLGTDLIYASEVFIECVVPKDKDGLSTLNLGTIVSGYRHFDEMVRALNSSGFCEVDVNCPLGDGWESQRNSVALIIMGGGSCTGSLVNNTSGTIIPYFLSAKHCGTSTGGWVFRFRWESPESEADCGTSAPSVDGPQNMTINGATMRSNSSNSDFVLAELNTAPDPAWGIYYAGWDRSGVPATQLTCIHHPAGDVKKISRDEDDAVESTWSGTSANSHWRVPSWDQGVTEGGSSGSPLFDQNKRVVGQLHGGASYCLASPSNMWDDYGQFAVSWTGGGTDATRLSNWLDPSDSDPLFIDGIDPAALAVALDASLNYVSGASNNICGSTVSPVITIGNSGTSTLTMITIQYGFDGVNTLQYVWTGSMDQFESATVTLPAATMTAGDHTFEAYIQTVNAVSDENDANDNVASAYTTVLGGEIETLTLILDCYGSENTWQVENASDEVVYSGGPYSNAMMNDTIIQEMCLANECHTFTLTDSYGDGISGCINNTGEDGSYTIARPSGYPVAALEQEDANFGTLHTNEFCWEGVGLKTNLKDAGILIYPNPAKESLFVQSTNNILQLELLNVTGQKLLELNTLGNSIQLSLTEYTAGIYFVQVLTEEGSITQQLVIE
jgi:lysyl endopeptidase